MEFDFSHYKQFLKVLALLVELKDIGANGRNVGCPFGSHGSGLRRAKSMRIRIGNTACCILDSWYCRVSFHFFPLVEWNAKSFLRQSPLTLFAQYHKRFLTCRRNDRVAAESGADTWRLRLPGVHHSLWWEPCMENQEFRIRIRIWILILKPIQLLIWILPKSRVVDPD